MGPHEGSGSCKAPIHQTHRAHQRALAFCYNPLKPNFLHHHPSLLYRGSKWKLSIPLQTQGHTAGPPNPAAFLEQGSLSVTPHDHHPSTGLHKKQLSHEEGLVQHPHPPQGAPGRRKTGPSAPHLLMAISIWASVTLSSLLRFRTTPSMSSKGRCWTTLARALDGGSSSGSAGKAELSSREGLPLPSTTLSNSPRKRPGPP